MVPMSQTLDTVGFFARDAQTMSDVGYAMVQRNRSSPRGNKRPSKVLILEDVLDIPWYDDAEELTSSLATDCNDYDEIRHDILMMIFGALVVFCAELNLLLVVVDSWRKVRSRRRYEDGKES